MQDFFCGQNCEMCLYDINRDVYMVLAHQWHKKGIAIVPCDVALMFEVLSWVWGEGLGTLQKDVKVYLCFVIV